MSTTAQCLPMKTTKNAKSPPNTDIQVHLDFCCIVFSFCIDVQYPKYSESAVEFVTSAQYISSRSETIQLAKSLRVAQNNYLQLSYHSLFHLVFLLIVCESNDRALGMDKEEFSYYSHQQKLDHTMGITVEGLYPTVHLMRCWVARGLNINSFLYTSYPVYLCSSTYQVRHQSLVLCSIYNWQCWSIAMVPTEVLRHSVNGCRLKNLSKKIFRNHCSTYLQILMQINQRIIRSV